MMRLCPKRPKIGLYCPVVDPFAAWLACGRDAGDGAARAQLATATAGYAARILDAVAVPPAAMLDIGSGEGLVAWAALARWPEARVTLTDISAPLLGIAMAQAAVLGVAPLCKFLEMNAARLEGVGDASQNLVTSRSALAYVADKAAAFAEIFRVLAPGGMLSIAEPLFREEALAACAMRRQMARAPNPLLALLHKWKAAQFPDTDAAMAATPLTNYSERDIVHLVRSAGFDRVHLELHINVQPALPRDWDVFCATSPHPFAPPLVGMEFSAEEWALLEKTLRPEIETGMFSTTERMLYLTAWKPG